MGVKTIEAHEIEQITFIKAMSRLHDKLCEILDNINICYSFQV